MSKKLKILLINLSGTFGNDEFILFQLALELHTRQHEVKIICLQNSQFYFRCRKSSLPVIEIDYKLLSTKLKLVLKLIKIIKNEKVDIIHSSSSYDRSITAAAAFAAKALHVSSLNNLEPLVDGYIDKKFSQHSLHNLIVSSKIVKENLISNNQIEGSKISVVQPGINPDNFSRDEIKRRQVRTLLGYADDNILIGNIGNLLPYEGQSLLLEAFADILPQFPRARVVIIGDGELKGELTRISQRLGILQQVLFAGHRDDLSSMYSSFDIYVQPYAEGIKDIYPLTVLQALAYKLPIIVTNIGEMAEFINEGENGFLLNQRDANLLTEKLSKLLSDNSLRQKMAENSLKLFNQKFHSDKMADGVIDIYLKVLNSMK